MEKIKRRQNEKQVYKRERQRKWNAKKTSDVKKRQKTGEKKRVRRDKLQKGKEENEVENEKRGWKKSKGRDIPRILSATYCSKRTKAA